MLVTVKLFVKIFLTNKSNRFTNNNRNRRYSKLIQFMKAITYYYPCYILQNFPTINSHDITKILLKVALNTHNHQLSLLLFALTKTTIWLTSNLSFAPLYQYVIGGPVGTPVWVTYEWPYVPSNQNGDCKIMKVLLNFFACYEQSDWSKCHNHIYHIIIYSWHPHVTDNGVSSGLPRCVLFVKGTKWKIGFNQISKTLSLGLFFCLPTSILIFFIILFCCREYNWYTTNMLINKKKTMCIKDH